MIKRWFTTIKPIEVLPLAGLARKLLSHKCGDQGHSVSRKYAGLDLYPVFYYPLTIDHQLETSSSGGHLELEDPSSLGYFGYTASSQDSNTIKVSGFKFPIAGDLRFTLELPSSPRLGHPDSVLEFQIPLSHLEKQHYSILGSYDTTKDRFTLTFKG